RVHFTLSLHDALPISIPEPDARPALAGVLRGLDSGWFGLEVEATDAGTTERWRHAVALLDERYQSVDERLATTEGITVAALAATDRKSTRLNSSHVKI